MRSAETIKKLIKNTKIKTNPKVNKSVLDGLLNRMDRAGGAEVNAPQQDTWRIIMKSRITKFAMVAVLVAAVLLSITFLDKTVTPAYAIGQTIEAFRNIRFLHLVGYNESGAIQDERWIEIKADGTQGKYRQDAIGLLLVVDDGITKYVYHRDKNTVLLYGKEGPQYTWIANLHDFFKDMAGNSSVTIEENIEYDGQKAHLVRWLKLNVECYIDTETKLPIALGMHRIFYDQQPESIFDIPQIPETAILVDKRTSNKSTEEPGFVRDEKLAQQTFDKARVALANGEYQESIKLFKEVFQLEGIYRNWAWFWLGQAYNKLGEYDSAIEAYSKVIEMFAKHNLAPHYSHLARGLAFRATGNEQSAWDDFVIALPVMIDSLRNIQGTQMFDSADDPQGRGKGLLDQERFDKMILRLEEVAGDSMGLQSNLTKEELISSWEKWWDHVSTE